MTSSEKHTIKRTELGFLTDGEECGNQEVYFNPKDPIEVNLSRFIDDFTAYDIINTTEIFRDEACEKINKKFNTFGIE